MAIRRTRREMLTRGIAVGGGAVAAAGLSATIEPASEASATSTQSGVEVLTRALRAEQLIVIAYEQVVSSPVVKQPVKGELQAMLVQEHAHLSLLKGEVTGLGGSVPSPPGIRMAQEMLTDHQVHWSLTDLINQHDCLKLLIDVESLVENAYFRAIGKLGDGALVQICAEIMACEAQHWTVLSGLLNHQDPTRAVPYPFVAGAP